MLNFVIKFIDTVLYWSAYFGVFTLILLLWKILTNFKNTFIFIVGVTLAFIISYFSKEILRIRRIYILFVVIVLWVLNFYLFNF